MGYQQTDGRQNIFTKPFAFNLFAIDTMAGTWSQYFTAADGEQLCWVSVPLDTSGDVAHNIAQLECYESDISAGENVIHPELRRVEVVETTLK